MKNKILFFILAGVIVFSGYFSFLLNTGKLFKEYENLWQFRLLHPDILPNPDMIRLTSAGNTTSYADSLWMSLIQYIGDNIGNDRYQSFLNPLIEKIIELHPHFIEPYNLVLLLSPNMNPEKEDYTRKRLLAEKALTIGEIGIEKNCNSQILEEISQWEFSPELFENTKFKNPCNDDMLAYNVAITANELSLYEKAKKYFKIASVQEGAPGAAKFLGPLMDAKLGDNKTAGERYLLLSVDAYDEDPYICKNAAMELLGQYKTVGFSEFIAKLRPIEESLIEPKDTSNPVATSGNTCNGYLVRAMKQFYLSYIYDISQDYPDISTGSGLIEKGLLKSIPTIREQTGWTVVKQDGIWRFSE